MLHGPARATTGRRGAGGSPRSASVARAGPWSNHRATQSGMAKLNKSAQVRSPQGNRHPYTHFSHADALQACNAPRPCHRSCNFFWSTRFRSASRRAASSRTLREGLRNLAISIGLGCGTTNATAAWREGNDHRTGRHLPFPHDPPLLGAVLLSPLPPRRRLAPAEHLPRGALRAGLPASVRAGVLRGAGLAAPRRPGRRSRACRGWAPKP